MSSDDGKIKKKNKKKNDDEFVESLARIAVAQICDSVGLQGCHVSAFNALSNVMCKYVQDLGKVSSFYASLAGRGESNVFDVVRGMEELGVCQGFAGGSDFECCVLESGIVKDVMKFVGVTEEVGFAYLVPEFPVVKEREAGASFLRSGETPKVECVPSWLPCFPDAKTYTSSDSGSMEETEVTQADQDEKVVETSLLKSEKCLASNGFHVPVFEPGVNGGREQVSNPFLASPLEYGEKVVSLVSVPERLVVEEDVVQSLSLWAKDVSPLGRIAPIIQGLKTNDFEVAVEKRPVVQLKFQTGKKSIGNLDAIPWFADDDSRDEKKRKKEIIVNGSFENGKHIEMTQL